MNQAQTQNSKNLSRWDKIGVFISSLCIVHCLLLPLLIVAFPTVASFLSLDEDMSHVLLMIFLVPAAGFAIYSGYRMHGEIRPLRWLIAGVMSVVFGTFFAHNILAHNWESFFVILGSVLLVRGHLLNSHHCKKCEEEHHCIWEHADGEPAQEHSHEHSHEH